MKYTHSIAAILALSTLLGACSAEEAKKPIENVQQNEAETTQETIKVETKLLVKEEGGMSLDVSYPILSGMANIEKQGELNAHFLALAKNVESQTREEEKNLVEAESPAHAGGSLEVSEHMSNEQFISLNLTGYQYSGGANGTPYHIPFVYDLKLEKELVLADLFEDAVIPEEALVTLVNEAIQASDYGELLFEPIPAIKAEQKFYLTEDSVVFVYDKYEYTAGAAGAPEVPIKKEKLPTLKNEYR